MKFSLVSTVYNEKGRLASTLSDIENQTLKPSEVVITDAGSKDGTYEELVRWSTTSVLKIKILQKVGCNVAEGRNLAIQNTSNELIVSTDFGCRFDSHWLESLVLPFGDPAVQVVGGAYRVQEASLQSMAAKANYVLTNGYAVDLDESFIPSSRSIAYYKRVWQDAGGYCEWLTLAADDLVFGKVVRAKGYAFKLIHQPYVSWGRHEKMKGYAKESYRYGLGDGEAKVNFRNSVVLLTENMMRLFFFVTAFLLLIKLVPAFFSLLLIFLLPGFRPYYKTLAQWMTLCSKKYNVMVLLFCIPMLEVTRWNYLKGYIKGYFFSSPPIQKASEELRRVLA